MRCFRKSIRWCAEAFAVSALFLALAPEAGATPPALADGCAPGINQAIVAALKQRMSGAVEFRLSDVSCSLNASGDGVLLATAVPGSRTGRPIRFAITRAFGTASANSVRVGEAVATVTAVGPAVRATHDLTRSVILTAPDVEQTEAPLDDVPLRPTLTIAAVIGARVTRPLRAGQIVDDVSIVPVAAVKSGDRVRGVMRVATVEVETVLVATDSGLIDQIIRVINPENRHAMRARVVAKGEVEVIDGR
jgi:flagella basal body P-ring formation protein FlgA